MQKEKVILKIIKKGSLEPTVLRTDQVSVFLPNFLKNNKLIKDSNIKHSVSREDTTTDNVGDKSLNGCIKKNIPELIKEYIRYFKNKLFSYA